MARCKSENCKTKLSEYRDLTSKQYNDIDTLENDIRDKDAFAQSVVKARNDLKKEIDSLKKKNKILLNENNELLEKVDQLDEDTDDGVQMLRNAHERERKLNKELEDYKKIVNEIRDKTSKLEQEKEELNNKFNFIKVRFEKSLKENQEFLALKEKENKSLEAETMDLKAKIEKQSNEHKKEIDTLSEFVKKLEEETVPIEKLETNNKSLKNTNDDLMDELEEKNMKIKDLELQAELKTSVKSLSDELSQLEVYSCRECDATFLDQNDLKEHDAKSHGCSAPNLRWDLLNKIKEPENTTSVQKFNLSTSVFQLKKKELKEVRNCKRYCKQFCRMNHQKHCFVKSKSDEILSRLEIDHKNPDNPGHIKSFGFCAIRKCYACHLCEKDFQTQGDLKKHKRSEHKERERKVEK